MSKNRDEEKKTFMGEISPYEDGTTNFKDEEVDLSGDRKISSDKGDVEIASLHTKKSKGRLNVQPDFQRLYVWNDKKASCLVESVLLRIPLPTVYLSEEKDGKQSVIDGQQRLGSFFKYKDGEFALTGLQIRRDLNGKRYEDLDEESQLRIDEYKIRVVTFEKDSDPDLKFEIFQRLNSGAVPLNEQEMRNCLYRGKYNTLLVKLSQNRDFGIIMGLDGRDKRMKDVEYTLRFAAFYFNSWDSYKSPMKKFMNDEMQRRADISEADAKGLEMAFKNAVSCIFSLLREDGSQEKAFRRWFYDKKEKMVKREPRQFSASMYDILMWSFARKNKNEVMSNLDSIREALIHLMISDEEFSECLTRATSNTKSVHTRFRKWDNILSEILSDEKQPRCFSASLKREMFDNDPTCAICKNQIRHIDDAAVDHIEQYWRGGKTIPENARLAHRYCNMARPRKE